MKKKSSTSVIIKPSNIKVEVPENTPLLNCLMRDAIEIDHSCGGGASCGTCRIVVENKLQELPDRNEYELPLAEAREFEPQERLACQLENPPDGMEFHIP